MTRNRLRLLVPPALAGLVLLAACARSDRQPSAAEMGEPEYQRALQLEKQGRPQEALAAYLKVIALRGEDSAPESHLEAGVIYLQHVKDPIEAIRHFKKYLELQPNSQQAGLVRQQIDAAKRDFARTLMAQPLENPSDRMRLQEQIGALQRENDQLKAENAALRGGAPVPATAVSSGEPALLVPSVRQRSSPPAPAGDTAVTLVPLNQVVTANLPSRPVAPSKVVAHPPAPKTSTPAAAGRKYTVQAKDTLYKIAQRYPGTGPAAARVQAIFEANRDVMKTATDLRPGMELRIP